MSRLKTKTLGIGLIGIGWMGRLHTRAYRELNVAYPELFVKPRLVIGSDTVANRLVYVKDALGYEFATIDWREVINHPQVDLISICAPNYLHAEMGVAAARAGKAFWIEKPVGRDAAETLLVAEAVRQSGVVTSVGFNYRHAPAVEHAKALIAQGRLGRITNVRGVFFADYSSDPKGALSWRFKRDLAGSGVLGDLMVHMADLMHYLIGPIEATAGITRRVYDRRPILPMGHADHYAKIEGGQLGEVENEDIAQALIRFGPDSLAPAASGTLEVSRVSVGPRTQCSFEIYGVEGSLRWNFERMNELEVALDREDPDFGYRTVFSGPSFGEFSRFQPGAGVSMGYDDLKVIEAAKLVSAFCRERYQLSELTNLPPANVFDALLANRVASTIEISAVENRWQSVEPTPGTTAAGG